MGKQGTAGHPSGEEGVEGGLLVRDLVWRGLASREVKLLFDLLNSRSVVTGGPKRRIQVGSWFGVWGWRGLAEPKDRGSLILVRDGH